MSTVKHNRKQLVDALKSDGVVVCRPRCESIVQVDELIAGPLSPKKVACMDWIPHLTLFPWFVICKCFPIFTELQTLTKQKWPVVPALLSHVV